MNMRSYSCCWTSTIQSRSIGELTSTLKLVSDESRLKILCILSQGTHCVCEIENHLKLSQSLISHHLRDLREAKLIEFKKEKNKVYYFLTEKGKEITKVLFSISSVIARNEPACIACA
jgi:DNA-binding transcriptional ArsR family regulator